MLSRQYLRALVKAASPYEGMQQMSLYQHAPLGKKRDLSEEEKQDVEEGQGRWMPELFQSYATRPTDMMASPGKQSLLFGLGGAGLGGLGGAMVGNVFDGPYKKDSKGAAIGALVGALGVGGASALMTYLSREAENKGLVDQMRRLPPGATKRDLLADPVYNQDNERNLAIRQGIGSGVGFGLGARAASAFF